MNSLGQLARVGGLPRTVRAAHRTQKAVCMRIRSLASGIAHLREPDERGCRLAIAAGRIDYVLILNIMEWGAIGGASHIALPAEGRHRAAEVHGVVRESPVQRRRRRDEGAEFRGDEWKDLGHVRTGVDLHVHVGGLEQQPDTLGVGWSEDLLPVHGVASGQVTAQRIVDRSVNRHDALHGVRRDDAHQYPVASNDDWCRR